VFADAGETWTRGFDRSALKTSLGGECSADVVAGFFAHATIVAGIARGRDASGTTRDRTTAYVRLGRAF
jgi:hypothetical protein